MTLSHDPSPALDTLRSDLPTDAHRARFDRLMAMLDTPLDQDGIASRTARIESAVGAVAAARDTDTAARVGVGSPLDHEDAQRVDRWIDGQHDGAIDRLVTRLELPLDAGRTTRIDSTLEAVQHSLDAQHSRLRLDPTQDGLVAPRRMRLRDLGAVAAVLLVAGAIIVPALTSLETNTWSSQTTANLKQAGFAASLFAQDNDTRVPHAVHTQAAQLRPDSGSYAWWKVGDPSVSHSANLFSLISNNYVSHETLNAPGNTDAPESLDQTVRTDWANLAQVSYSYRMFDAWAPPRMTDLHGSILLADRSPVVRQALENGTINPSMNSDNHRGKGQHAAYADGSVVFFRSPVLPNGDNIWLPARAERTGTLSLRGDERPAGPADQFVGP